MLRLPAVLEIWRRPQSMLYSCTVGMYTAAVGLCSLQMYSRVVVVSYHSPHALLPFCDSPRYGFCTQRPIFQLAQANVELTRDRLQHEAEAKALRSNIADAYVRLLEGST